MMKPRFERLPAAVATGLAVLVVAACAIHLRGDESAPQSPGSLAAKSDPMVAKLEQCRTVGDAQKQALLDCEKIWAEQRKHFFNGSGFSSGSDSRVGAGPSPSSVPRKDESRLPSGYPPIPSQVSEHVSSTDVIDQFLETFTRYIDSGFGLLSGEVGYLATTLAAIDITLAGLFWSFGPDENIIARLVKKTLFVGVFALITGIRSDPPGQITAQVTEAVYDSPTGRARLIPQGARLIGTYDSQVAFGQSRVLLVWTRLIMPNGRSIVLERQPGADAAGYSGLADEVDNHWKELLGAAALSTLLAVGTEVNSGADTRSTNSDLIAALRRGAGDSASQTGQQLVRRNLNIQPTLTIRPGFPVRVIVNRDLVLEPYRG